MQLVQTPASLHYGVPARATNSRTSYQPGVPERHTAEMDRHVSNRKVSLRLDLRAAFDVAALVRHELRLSHLGDVPHVSHPLRTHCSLCPLLVPMGGESAVFSWV